MTAATATSNSGTAATMATPNHNTLQRQEEDLEERATHNAGVPNHGFVELQQGQNNGNCQHQNWMKAFNEMKELMVGIKMAVDETKTETRELRTVVDTVNRNMHQQLPPGALQPQGNLSQQQSLVSDQPPSNPPPQPQPQLFQTNLHDNSTHNDNSTHTTDNSTHNTYNTHNGPTEEQLEQTIEKVAEKAAQKTAQKVAEKEADKDDAIQEELRAMRREFRQGQEHPGEQTREHGAHEATAASVAGSFAGVRLPTSCTQNDASAINRTDITTNRNLHGPPTEELQQRKVEDKEFQAKVLGAIHVLGEQLNRVEKVAEKAAVAVDETKTQIGELQTVVDAVNRDNEGLKQEMKRLNEKLEEKENEVDNLKKELAASLKVNAQLGAENNELKKKTLSGLKKTLAPNMHNAVPSPTTE